MISKLWCKKTQPLIEAENPDKDGYYEYLWVDEKANNLLEVLEKKILQSIDTKGFKLFIIKEIPSWKVTLGLKGEYSISLSLYYYDNSTIHMTEESTPILEDERLVRNQIKIWNFKGSSKILTGNMLIKDLHDIPLWVENNYKKYIELLNKFLSSCPSSKKGDFYESLIADANKMGILVDG